MAEELTRAPAQPGGLLARARLPRWSRAHVGIAATAALAGLLNLAALHQGDAVSQVLVAARPLAPGIRLQPDDLVTVEVQGKPALADALLLAGDERARGWLLRHGLRAGEPVRVSDLRPPGWSQGRRAMSVPVEAEHAVGGALRAGDQVDIVGVADGRATWVVLGADVLDMPAPESAGGLGDISAYAVTIAVSEDQALRLALALREGHVEVLRATGAAPVAAPAASAALDPQEAEDAA
jgi:Flp pilus assembly protein CpaB